MSKYMLMPTHMHKHTDTHIHIPHKAKKHIYMLILWVFRHPSLPTCNAEGCCKPYSSLQQHGETWWDRNSYLQSNFWVWVLKTGILKGNLHLVICNPCQVCFKTNVKLCHKITKSSSWLYFNTTHRKVGPWR